MTVLDVCPIPLRGGGRWILITSFIKINNIVIIDNKNEYRIYTINDSDENLENFVNELNNYIPMLEKYEQTTMDKFIRKLKL